MKKIVKFSAFMLAAMFAATSFTSCGDDDPANPDGPDVQDVLKNNGIVARAQTNGKVIIEGSITSGKKIKWFGLSSTESKDCDIADWSKDAQEKTKDPENGKSFTLTLSGQEVSMSNFPCYLTIKTDGQKIYEKVGEDFEFKLGDADNATVGSYGSLKTGKVYLLGDFYDKTNKKITNAEIFKALDVFVNLDGKLRPISEAKFYQNITAADKQDAVKSFIGDGTIISSNKVIARVGDGAKEGSSSSNNITYTYTGVAVGVKGSVTVSVDDCQSSLSK